MFNRGKVKAKIYLLAVILCFPCLLWTIQTHGQQHRKKEIANILTIYPDSPTYKIPALDTIPASWAKKLTYRYPGYLFSKNWGDTSEHAKLMSFYSKDTLTSVFDYSADDSAVILIPTKQILLYSKANVKSKQEDIDLTAQYIQYDQATNKITAYGGTDTSKGPLNQPLIVQQGSKTQMDTITINTKSQRLLTKNTYYNEGEIFVHADVVKTVDKNTAYAWRSRFTTCNLDTPHFDFVAKKMKLIKNNVAVSGPAYPEFEGVPIPIVLPFGIFPLERGRHSGILPPQFVNNDSYGLGLEGLGYYKVFNDNWDLTTRTNLYSYGGYMVSFAPRYYKRYRYSGNLSFQFQNTVLLNSGSTFSNEEFTKNKSFQLNWSHSMDSKARPGISFSASVNAGSTQYNKYVANNPVVNFQNQMSSSITWAKMWGDGKYNLSVAANHSQNNISRLVNVNAPTVNFSMNTRYPFARKEAVGPQKWYEKTGIGYSGTLINQIAFYDSAMSFKKLLDTTNYGVQHSIPITLSLPALGPVMIAPSITYNENWYGRTLHTEWNRATQRVDTTASARGLYRAYQTSFGVSMSTRIFGNYNFKPTSNIVAIHHEIRPNISFSYSPNTNSNNYYWVQTNNRLKDSIESRNGKRYIYGDSIRVSKFAGNVVGAFGEGQFGGITFGIDNLLEMKKKNTSDTTGDDENKYKKIKLIDGLSITSGYNFLADSLKWQQINISFRTTLFDKISINGGAVIDQYYDDPFTGARINKLMWADGKIGRFTSGNISMSSSFQSKKADEKKKQEDTNLPYDPTMSLTDQQNQLNYIRSNPAEFVDFDIPWNVSTSFAFNFSRYRNPTNYRMYTNTTASLNLNGDFSITPKWKGGGNLMFDVKQQKVGMMTLFMSREMHCWQMSINITPIGLYKSFSIVLNPKSGIMRDLRINRSRYFYNQ
ncbi:MAG: LPS-assembly protein LptD [Pseudopedobacter saltans]|uniref:LPS-assembly protein LptD n=1 Tax=Pseudopedobacter saltans TaxID=151895 RepID=A0A2W5EXK2_9SPHI|nr:MAG: LPS-assembly protein LptD [Pseudopedobacter saltans]